MFSQEPLRQLSAVYFGIAYWGGKPVMERFKKFLGFGWKDVLHMERRLIGRVGLMIFLFRAIPIVPLSLISAGAGVLRLSFPKVLFWTFAGSLPRCLILGYLGYFTRDAYEGLAHRLNSLESLLSVGIVVLVAGLVGWGRLRWKKSTMPTDGTIESIPAAD